MKTIKLIGMEGEEGLSTWNLHSLFLATESTENLAQSKNRALERDTECYTV